MALILLLCVIFPVITAKMESPKGIVVNMTCYNVSYILDLKGEFRHKVVIRQMGILQNKRILYYSYDPKIEDPEYFKIGFINLDDPSKFGELSSPIDEEMDFSCFDFDQVNNIMYLGGGVGVYKLTTSNNSLSYVSSQNEIILSLFFKDKVYFVTEAEHEIVFEKAGILESLLKDDRKRSREEYLPKFTVKKFVITDDNTVVFLSTQGLFATKAVRNSKAYRLSTNVHFRGLVVDLIGDVYTWCGDGIYKVVLDKNLANSTVVRIADVPYIGALTFDNDNSILIAVEKYLLRLDKPADMKC